jgi:hypothetical protein
MRFNVVISKMCAMNCDLQYIYLLANYCSVPLPFVVGCPTVHVHIILKYPSTFVSIKALYGLLPL